MSTTCFRSLQGLALRVTKLDSCCNPVVGPCSTVVSESFITIALTAQLEAADEFTVKLANGTLCLSEVGCATLKRYDVSVEICNADPDLFNIIAGVKPVLDFAGNNVGYEVDQSLGADPNDSSAGCGNFSLEFWSRIPRDQCVAGQPQQYLYWLLPCVTAGRVGDVTINNGPLNFSFVANAIPTSAWGKGPYKVVGTSASDVVGGPLLTAIGFQTALHVQATTVPPPVGACGCKALA